MIEDITEENTKGLTQAPGHYAFFAPQRGPEYSTQAQDIRNNKEETVNYYGLMLSDGTPGVVTGTTTIARPEGWEKFKLVGMSIEVDPSGLPIVGQNLIDGGFEHKGQRYFGQITKEDVKRGLEQSVERSPEELQAEAVHKAVVQQKKEHESLMRKHFEHNSKHQKVDTRGHGGNKHKGNHHHQRHGR